MISGLLHSHFGLENVGFHLSDREVTLDMNGEVSLEQLRLIEQEANTYVWKNLPVNISWPTAEELESLNYRRWLSRKMYVSSRSPAWICVPAVLRM